MEWLLPFPVMRAQGLSLATRRELGVGDRVARLNTEL